MDPVRVTALTRHNPDTNEVVRVDAYDARELLRRGNLALSAGRYSEARTHYSRLIREFPESQIISAAYYNTALSFEREGRLAEAAERYVTIFHEMPESSDALDSIFQAAGCFEQLERWQDVVNVLESAMARDDLSPDERLEAMTRIGTALIRQGQFEEGERQLRRAVLFSRRSGPEAIRTDYYLAQAQHYLGEAPRQLMALVELTNDESQFRQALEQRCELLLRAQTQYVQAIRVGNAHWGAASAYRIGELYSTLYNDVMRVPIPDVEVPPDLTTPEEIHAFRDEYPRHYRRLLREYLEPLLHNAIRWWESNLMMVERTGVQGQWVEETRTNLARVQALLEEIEEEGQQDSVRDINDPVPAP